MIICQDDNIFSMDMLKKLGNNIRAERNRLNLTQEQLAELANIQMHHISNIEAGKVDIRFSTLVAILHAFNLPFEKLYNLNEME